jgi:hypothetical protein
MVRTAQVKKTGSDVTRIPEAEPTRRGSVPWLVGALVIMIVWFVALAGLTFYQRYVKSDVERLAAEVPVAWDAAGPAALSGVYDRNAVLVDADGTKAIGVKAIIAAAKDRGPTFTMTQVGDVAVAPDGSYATIAYRYAGHGRGSGIAVVKILDGKIIRQWNFESSVVPAQPTR